MTPRVRVVVVDHGGAELTLECLRSLATTDWPPDHLEVVLVDNASTVSVADAVAAELPAVRVVRSAVNLGFAGGNNLALRDLGGVDLVALVNNDATVTPGWLAPLVAALESDPALGAACPRLLLAQRYRELRLRTTAPVAIGGVRVDGHEVGRRAHAVRGFGPPRLTASGAEVRDVTDEALLRVPAARGPSGVTELALSAGTAATVTVSSGGLETTVETGVPGAEGDGAPRWWRVAVGGPELDVVNNAGNELLAGAFGADRGYLELDGPAFEEPVDVFGWCGAAVLLRREYLEDVGLFDERLFLYYEDLELSWRGARRGWRYRYVPTSVVRHVHGATTTTGSDLTAFHNSRNRLLVLTRHGTPGQVWRALTRTGPRPPTDRPATLLTGLVPADRRRARDRRALGAYLRLAPRFVASRLGDRLRGLSRRAGPDPGRRSRTR